MPIQGDVLEDVELVESLEETKRTATNVTVQVKAAKESEVRSTANSYRLVPGLPESNAAPVQIM